MAHVADITIQSSKVPGDLSDFVVYVDLSDLGTPFWDTVANGGGDIRVYKEGGTTELAREVVSCDTATDTGELHFKYTGTLSSSSNTIVEIHADGVSSDYAVTATYGRNNVWSDYGIVYHDGSGQTDSTGNSRTTTLGGGLTAGGGTGKLGNSTDFDGTNDNATIAGYDGVTGSDNRSYSFWINYTSTGTSDRPWVCGANATNQKWTIRSAETNGDALRVETAGSYKIGTTSIGDGSWHLCHVVLDGTTLNDTDLYVDGSIEGSTSGSGLTNTINTATGNGMYFGYSPYTVDPGYIDMLFEEVRIYEGVRSADWITTEYNNQNDTSTFYTVTDIGGASLSTTKPMQPIWFM